MDVDVKFTLNKAFLAKLQTAQTKALEETAGQVYSDLVLSQTMPMDSGDLQNVLTWPDYSDAANGKVSIVSSGPYARRLYFHPEFNFRQDKNPKAGGRWLDPYLPGHEKGDFVPKVFANRLKKWLGR